MKFNYNVLVILITNNQSFNLQVQLLLIVKLPLTFLFRQKLFFD